MFPEFIKILIIFYLSGNNNSYKAGNQRYEM
jgi:hypothetical protein